MRILETTALRRYSLVHAIVLLAGAAGAVAMGTTFPFAELGVVSLSVLVLAACRHPQARTLANGITGARMALMYAALVAFQGQPVAFAVCATAVLVLDGIDGWAARRLGGATEFGGHFDMEVDAWSVACVCLLLYVSGQIGAWILIPGLMRYAYVAARGLRPAAPRERRSRIGRYSFVIIFGSLICACVLPAGWALLPGALATVVAAATFFPDFLALTRRSALHAAS